MLGRISRLSPLRYTVGRAAAHLRAPLIRGARDAHARSLATRSGSEVLRIANCSGFFGDRLSAAKEMVEGGDIDFLTGDYLAELTMAILWKQRERDPLTGYVPTFLRQTRDVISTCHKKGIKIVANAGGLNPRALAFQVQQLADEFGLDSLKIACVQGDNVLDKIPPLQDRGHPFSHLDTGSPLSSLSPGQKIVTANAYLGGRGIARALSQGADIVITGRVTDAALVIGPAAAHYNWAWDDYDKLAGALVAGHVIECGPQCTGGNFSDFTSQLPYEADTCHLHPGFPIAEISEDGSAVITKHEGTGGVVNRDTVIAQLVYEIDSPLYRNPDVTAMFNSTTITDLGQDRVEISGTQGLAPPDSLKVCLNYIGGYKNEMTFALTGNYIDEKADLLKRQITHHLGSDFDDLSFQLQRANGFNESSPTGSNLDCTSYLRVVVKDTNKKKVDRAFTSSLVELALSSYPGFFVTAPPQASTAFAVYWPTLIPRSEVEDKIRFLDRGNPHPDAISVGSDVGGNEIDGGVSTVRDRELDYSEWERPQHEWSEETRLTRLGDLFFARSGDKGGNANLGIWTHNERAYDWAVHYFTEARLNAMMFESEPGGPAFHIHVHPLPNINGINFVVKGLLGEGVSSSVRRDAQAKGLGEFFLHCMVPVPEDVFH